jgi:hypothetical protein
MKLYYSSPEREKLFSQEITKLYSLYEKETSQTDKDKLLDKLHFLHREITN